MVWVVGDLKDHLAPTLRKRPHTELALTPDSRTEKLPDLQAKIARSSTQHLPTTKPISSSEIPSFFNLKALWLFSRIMRVRSPVWWCSMNQKRLPLSKLQTNAQSTQEHTISWSWTAQESIWAYSKCCPVLWVWLRAPSLPPQPWGASQTVSLLPFSPGAFSFLHEGHSSVLENSFSLLFLQQHQRGHTDIRV